MDRAALSSNLDWLVAARGDPVKGLPASAWAEKLEGVDRNDLLRAAIAVTRLLVQDWADQHKDDKRPQRAIDAAEAWLANPGPEALAEAKAAAKECTAARNETFGRDHRVPQAARHVAWAAGAKDGDTSSIFEALASTEEELLARIALLSEYHRGPEQRRAIVDAIRKVLLPPEPSAESPPSLSPENQAPVPYSADGHFNLGQRIIHKKFGEIVVTSVGETWIEVELPDASKKRLAHKP